MVMWVGGSQVLPDGRIVVPGAGINLFEIPTPHEPNALPAIASLAKFEVVGPSIAPKQIWSSPYWLSKYIE